MERAPAPTRSDRPRPGRPRRALVALLVVLTSVATLVSAIAVWSNRVLLDTDEWVATVGPLADDPAVARAVATFLVDQAAVAVDLERVAAEALPDRARVLAGPLAGAVRSFVTDRATELVRTDAFQTLWTEANRVAHRRAVALLRGEPGAITSVDGSVTLNLVPALALLLERLDTAGLMPRSFTPPAIDWSTPPEASVAALAEAVGRHLPPTFGQVAVFDSATLAQAQDAVALFERAVVLVVVLTVALAGCCLVLADDRRRTLVLLGLGMAVGLVVSRALVNATTDHVLGLITDEVDRSAALAVIRTVVRSLDSVTRALALVGVAVAATAYLTSGAAGATRFRAAVGRRRAGAAGTVGSVGRVVARHRDALRALGVLVALALLAVADLSYATLAVVVTAAATYQVVLARMTPDNLTRTG